jgi:hypothetical protein
MVAASAIGHGPPRAHLRNKNRLMMRQQNAPIVRRTRPRDLLAGAVKRRPEVGPKRLMKYVN